MSALIEVCVERDGGTFLAGRLFAAERGSAISFEYEKSWLERADRFALDPASLPLQRGMQHANALFGAFADCGPDRWGRMLIERAVRKGTLTRKPYRDLDYALALDDASRIGALRFRAHADGPFLSCDGSGKVPPLVRLSALLRSADAIHLHTETAEDLRFLLNQGSPLGGARPKSAVQLDDGRPAIAKFPKPDDTRDLAAGEILALTLAREAGIRTAEHRLVNAEGRGVSVVTRFDRTAEGRRIPFISAMTLLALPEDDSGSYAMLAEGIRQYGDQVKEDLRELWRRLVFSLLASNYDDHLRNHAFLMHATDRWSLSPAFDLNPVPEIDRARTPKTAIAEEGEEHSVAAALDVASRFGLDSAEAKAIVGEVHAAVGRWRKTGARLRLGKTALDAYASAFENPSMEEARQLLRL